MRNNLTETEINTIAALGFRVYMSTNPHFQTFCFYSDGERIGYIQRDDLSYALSVSTVHIANKQTGTGFGMGDCPSLTRECLERGFVTAPAWANSGDVASVKKYKSLEAFLASRGDSLTHVAG